MRLGLFFISHVQSFATKYARSEPEDVENLSESQKQTIINSFGVNCVQEKWDFLIKLLPDLIREKILQVFLESLIFQEIFRRFFMNPWWYMDGKMHPSDKGDDKFVCIPQLSAQRYVLLTTLIAIANPLMAGLWRSETNRLANATHFQQAPKIELGTYHRDRRHEPIKWLLKETSSEEEIETRYAQLHELYKMAVECAAEMGNIRGNISLQSLAVLPQTFNASAGDRVLAHEYHCLRNNSPKLDDRRILFFVYPGIVRRHISALERHNIEYSIPAYVVVSSPGEKAP
ncbi:uncharacterized protein N7479_000324 [Penicillium vulpinum]|uniref:uncharacterized protein n=1 Tax=Penicillium vulpinum TaxID=29845 RepID=UPI002549A2DB|nr:uncharacterized protein N7479_000324 [Penicillium vulpinum]KAJ5970406.1 hypothetical protein N7479_000324 [Penicillium vulpinum]